ncbi:MAG: hypothetical protein AB8C40_09615 [Gammaproteobacteria bacterium]
MKLIAIIFLIFISLVTSFWLGGKIASEQTAKSIDGVQAKLAFTHKDTYQKIKSDLIAGCNDNASTRLTHAIDEQMMLMAEYLQSSNNIQLEEYINLRDPKLLGKLRSYKVDWNKTWQVPKCKGS